MTLRTWLRNIASSTYIDGNTHYPSGKKKRYTAALKLIMNLFSGEKENHWTRYQMRKRLERRHIRKLNKRR
jgi:hypothetical protein